MVVERNDGSIKQDNIPEYSINENSLMINSRDLEEQFIQKAISIEELQLPVSAKENIFINKKINKNFAFSIM